MVRIRVCDVLLNAEGGFSATTPDGTEKTGWKTHGYFPPRPEIGKHPFSSELLEEALDWLDKKGWKIIAILPQPTKEIIAANPNPKTRKIAEETIPHFIQHYWVVVEEIN